MAAAGPPCCVFVFDLLRRTTTYNSNERGTDTICASDWRELCLFFVCLFFWQGELHAFMDKRDPALPITAGQAESTVGGIR